MINIIKTVREIFYKIQDKEQPYMDGFRDCLQYVIIGYEKSEQYNLYLLNRELGNENAQLRSIIYKLKKNKSTITDDNVHHKMVEYQYLIHLKNLTIKRQSDEIKRLYEKQKTTSSI